MMRDLLGVTGLLFAAICAFILGLRGYAEGFLAIGIGVGLGIAFLLMVPDTDH